MQSPLPSPPATFRRLGFLALVLLHLAGAAALWTGVSVRAAALCGALYLLQMFGVTAGYHRYFSHRSFETGPAMRAVLSFLSLSTLQRPVLWWAAKHRDHHRFSDTPRDVHSPIAHGFLRSQLTWAFYTDCDDPVAQVKDLRSFPEVRWLDRHWRMPFAAFALVCWGLAGWQGVVVGLVWSTLLVYHVTGTVNSLAHLMGRRRYATSDHSRNNPWIALATLGEGWHNNHHHYQSSCRQGFFWWELDVTWLVLKGLEKLGIVWNLREPPPEIRGDPWARAPLPRPAT